MPGATKSDAAEYYIEKKALGEVFYMERYCGDPDAMEEPAYFEQTIDSTTSTDSASKDLEGPALTSSSTPGQVGMTQAK